MIPTFITIIFLMLLFSKKFREALKSFLKYFPEFYDSLIVKYKDSLFKLSLILIATVFIIDFFIVVAFSIFETPENIFWNFLSDFIGAVILLYLLKRVVAILFNQNLNDYFKIDFGILKSFSLVILSIGLVLLVSYVTYPLASQLPAFEIFDEIRQEIFQKPKTGFDFILIVLSISIIPAFVEEIFFRGILYKNIRKKYGITISVIILTIIFYLFHIDPQMIFFLIIGNIVLCLSFEYTKSLVVPFVIHLGINFSSLLFYLNNQNAT
jgi:membrane protease YdiL (CAAX protease family)